MWLARRQASGAPTGYMVGQGTFKQGALGTLEQGPESGRGEPCRTPEGELPGQGKAVTQACHGSGLHVSGAAQRVRPTGSGGRGAGRPVLASALPLTQMSLWRVSSQHVLYFLNFTRITL